MQRVPLKWCQGDCDTKYHALLTANAGVNAPPDNPCQLLDFSLLKLAAGATYEAETPGREILAVILSGKATFEIDGQCFEKVGGRPNVFSGKPNSVYIPAGAKFSIQAEGAVEIALPSAPSDAVIEPYVIAPSQVANGVWGAANFKRYYHQILTLARLKALSRSLIEATLAISARLGHVPTESTPTR